MLEKPVSMAKPLLALSPEVEGYISMTLILIEAASTAAALGGTEQEMQTMRKIQTVISSLLTALSQIRTGPPPEVTP